MTNILSEKSINKITLKNTLLLLPFFFVLYFETVAVAGFTVSLLWKFVLFAFLPLVIMKRAIAPPIFVLLSLAYCVKSMIVIGIVSFPVETVTSVLGWISIPLIYWALASYLNSNMTKVEPCNSTVKLELWVISFLIFLAMTNIPFWLGLEPLVSAKTLASFGFEESVYIGIFQNVHATSGVLATVSISLLFFGSRVIAGKLRVLCFVLAGVAFVSMMQTYVRTGMLMFVVGFFLLNLNTFKTNKGLSLLMLLCFVVSLFYFVLFEPAFVSRLLDERVHGYSDGYQNIGSGRLFIWETNLNNLYNSGFMGILLGLGTGLSKQIMFETIGLSLVSHSGFIDAIVQNGVIGLVIYCSYFYFLFVFIRQNKNSPYYSLNISLYFMYLAFQFVQGGNQFIFTLFFAPLLFLQKAHFRNGV